MMAQCPCSIREWFPACRGAAVLDRALISFHPACLAAHLPPVWRNMFRLLALCLVIASAQAAAPPAKPWQQIENCQWKADRWNDGDSYHLITGNQGREI